MSARITFQAMELRDNICDGIPAVVGFLFPSVLTVLVQELVSMAILIAKSGAMVICSF